MVVFFTGAKRNFPKMYKGADNVLSEDLGKKIFHGKPFLGTYYLGIIGSSFVPIVIEKHSIPRVKL